jgi:hypothetical protein
MQEKFPSQLPHDTSASKVHKDLLFFWKIWMWSVRITVLHLIAGWLDPHVSHCAASTENPGVEQLIWDRTTFQEIKLYEASFEDNKLHFIS